MLAYFIIGHYCVVIRVHKILNRKGVTWKSGQRIKLLRGACAGVHKNNVYATIEYFLLGGIEGDYSGEWFSWLKALEFDVPSIYQNAAV